MRHNKETGFVSLPFIVWLNSEIEIKTKVSHAMSLAIEDEIDKLLFPHEHEQSQRRAAVTDFRYGVLRTPNA